MQVVVVGGGIVGSSAAARLAAREGVRVTLLEAHELGGAASGKAGGFLARDWCQGQPMDQLAQEGFALHAELGAALPVDFRRLDTWGAEDAGDRSRLGSTEDTAQVHPRKLTLALVERARALGAEVAIDGAVGLREADGARLVVLGASGKEYPADKIVLAMGPWTSRAAAWLEPRWPRAALALREVSWSKAHSVELTPTSPVGAEAIFAEGKDGSFEVYPRPDGSVYVCGQSESDVELPASAAGVLPSDGAAEKLRGLAPTVCGQLEGAEVRKEQACLLPVASDGRPLIGRLPDLPNVVVAAGHGCWGILAGPITGVLVEAIVCDDGKSSKIDLRPFDPARFR